MSNKEAILRIFGEQEVLAGEEVEGAERLDEARVHARLEAMGVIGPDGLPAVIDDFTTLIDEGSLRLVYPQPFMGPYRECALTEEGRSRARLQEDRGEA